MAAKSAQRGLVPGLGDGLACMKVLDLKCGQAHVFEGWFGSEADFQAQLARGLVSCPLCGSADIEKQLSAPRLNLRAQATGIAASRSEDSAARNDRDPRAAPAHERQASSAAGTLATLAASPEQAQALQALNTLQALQASYLQQARKVMASTQDVGSDFAEVARQMHYGETEERNIRGQTTPAEAVALIEEGIPVMPLPIPDALKGTLQ